MPIVFTREMAGWEPAESDESRVVFRPGPEAIKSLFGYAALAAGLSIMFFIGGFRTQSFAVVVHGLLWLIAISWPLSIVYQRMEFIKDAPAGVVRLRGQGVLFPFRREFPLRRTPLLLDRHKHYAGRAASGVGVHVGWNWTLMIMGESPMSMRIGYTAGPESPKRPPLEVRRVLAWLSNLFEVPIIEREEEEE